MTIECLNVNLTKLRKSLAHNLRKLKVTISYGSLVAVWQKLS